MTIVRRLHRNDGRPGMTTELLLAAAFAAGFFGSGHCIGMCGALVALLEQPAGRWPQRLSYNFGRLCFYALLGGLAGALGLVLTRIPGLDTGLMLLRLVAALLVIALALNLLFNAGSLRFLEQGGAFLWRYLSRFAGRVLPATTCGRALVAGFIWGALPCGLVYSAVAMAATTASFLNGALVMFAFWAGTLPALLAAGAMAGRLAGFVRNQRIRRVSGVVLLLAGISGLALPLAHTGSPGHELEHGAPADTRHRH